MNTHRTLLIALLSLGLATTAQAQVAEDSELFAQVMHLDRELFESGFNQCQLAALEPLIAKDLSFLHDQSGTTNRAQFFQAFSKNICPSLQHKPIRTLIPGTTQIFPLKNGDVLYGAIQQGMHRFHTKGAASGDTSYTIARFTHVWQLRDDQWQLTDALSFDHQQRNDSDPDRSTQSAPANAFRIFELSLASLSLTLTRRELVDDQP